MSEQQNLALVQEFYAALKRGDVTGLLNTLADDVAWSVHAPKTLSRWSGNARARGWSCRSSRNFRRCKMQNSLISEISSPCWSVGRVTNHNARRTGVKAVMGDAATSPIDI